MTWEIKTSTPSIPKRLGRSIATHKREWLIGTIVGALACSVGAGLAMNQMSAQIDYGRVDYILGSNGYQRLDPVGPCTAYNRGFEWDTFTVCPSGPNGGVWFQLWSAENEVYTRYDQYREAVVASLFGSIPLPKPGDHIERDIRCEQIVYTLSYADPEEAFVVTTTGTTSHGYAYELTFFAHGPTEYYAIVHILP